MLKCKTRSLRHWTVQIHCVGIPSQRLSVSWRTFSTWKRSRGILLVVPWSSKGIAKCLSRRACQGENWKKLYFSRTVEMKQPHTIKQSLWKKPFWMISEGLLLISIGLFCEAFAFSIGSVRVHGCFCFVNILKIYAFSPNFPLVASVIGGFYWLFLWNFKEIKHQPFSMT